MIFKSKKNFFLKNYGYLFCFTGKMQQKKKYKKRKLSGMI